MKQNVVLFLTAVIFSSCFKDSEAPNKYIDKLSGRWTIEHWEQTTYTGGEESGSSSTDDPGTVVLNVVNYGFYSEGLFEMDTPVNSPILSLINPDNYCFDTFLWNCDKERINFVIGWCDQKYVYTLTNADWGDRKQEWTWVMTDGDGVITMKEVWSLKRE